MRLHAYPAFLPLCLLASVASAKPRAVPADAAVVLTHGDPRVGTYVSNADGFETSSYWIEGPGGLVLIDTQFTPSGAAELVAWAERATGKRVKLAVILHANPDKFNGTATMQKRGIRVVTSAQVAALIPAVHKLRHGWFYERWKPDYPDQTPAPSAFGDRTTVLESAGLSIRLHVVGGGCSAAHVVAEWEGHVFVGDLVANGSHSWLELGLMDEWLARLAEIRKLAPKLVHPGRGTSGGPELLDRQEAYLRFVVATADQKGATAEDAEQKILAAYPGYKYARFVSLGISEVLRRRPRR